MSRQQKLILVGMGCAALGTLLLLEWPHPPKPASEAFDVALGCLLAPATCLASGIAYLANRRFFDPVAINGGSARSLEIAHRYLTNTVEQAVLATLAWLAFAAVLPSQAAAMLPTFAMAFVVARAAFWVGYAFAPWARAFGFGLAFYPTTALLVWSALAAASRALKQ